MADENWYRGDDWGGAAQAAFEARLGRARKESRPEYLRIKGLYLIESQRPARRRAGVELLSRLIETYAEDPGVQYVVAGAHEHLARYFARQGDAERAATHYRATLSAEERTNVKHGAELALASLLAREPSLARDGEALALLQQPDATSLFRDGQFEWALTQARLAARRGDADLAAAFACGALWLVRHDGPAAPRHPDVGLIREVDRATDEELRGLVAGGDPEAGAGTLVDDFRRSDGNVEWHWALTEQLGVSSPGHGDGGTTLGTKSPAEAARPVLAELRAAGFEDAFDLFEWTSQKRASADEVKRAAPILLRWMRDAEHTDVRGACAAGLADTRARKVAAAPVLDAFEALDDPAIGHPHGPIPDSLWDDPPTPPPVTEEIAALRRLKSNLGQALSKLARDEHFDRLAAIVQNSNHGSDRVFAFWALDYVKDPRAVDLMIEFVDDPDVGLSALRTLKTLRSERAEPVLRRFAEQPKLKRGSPGSGQRAIEIEVAVDGLKKLEAARAAGRARP